MPDVQKHVIIREGHGLEHETIDVLHRAGERCCVVVALLCCLVVLLYCTVGGWTLYEDQLTGTIMETWQNQVAE